jgi:basic membrane lipoprotein Med (substrate-binding protein (PBP1-ABC) superfamily)
MKPYILGAICIWFLCGVVGAAMLGQERLDAGTIAGGPITLWNGFNKPVND